MSAPPIIDVTRAPYNAIPGSSGESLVDNTREIQRAVIAAGRGGVVYFPPGIYKITSPIVITAAGVTFKGDGGSFRSGLQGPYGSVIQAGSAANEVVHWNGNQGSMIGMHVDGNGTAADALRVDGFDFVMSQCYVRRGVSTTLHVEGTRPRISGVYVVPEQMGTGVLLGPNVADAIVSDCRFIEAEDRALHVQGVANQFSNCHFNGVPEGNHQELALLEGGLNFFCNCYFDTGGESAVRIRSSNTKITGSIFVNGDGTSPAVVVEDGVGTNLTANLLGAGVAAPFSYGIELQGGTGSRAVLSANQAHAINGFFTGNRPEMVHGNMWIRSPDHARFYDYNSGTTTVANDGTVEHKLFAAPRSVQLTPATSNSSRFVAAHTLNDDTFTVRLFGSGGGAIGTPEDVHWYAEV